MGAALEAVAVEQRVAAPAAENGIEFPGQVGHVAQALAHALAEEGRLLVGGVAGDEHAAGPPAPRHQRVESVAGLAPELAFARADPALQQRPGALGCGGVRGVLASLQRNLPAPVAAGPDDVGAGTVGLAVLDAGVGQPRQTPFVDDRAAFSLPGLLQELAEAQRRDSGPLPAQVLLDLISLLRTQSLSAIDRFRAVSPQLRRQLSGPCYAQVEAQIDNLQFNDAADLLAQDHALPA